MEYEVFPGVVHGLITTPGGHGSLNEFESGEDITPASAVAAMSDELLANQIGSIIPHGRDSCRTIAFQ